VSEIQVNPNSFKMKIVFDPNFDDFVIDKGYVAIDGVSLTVCGKDLGSFWINLVPHTLKCVTLSSRKVNSLVNIEFDMIGKYVLSKKHF
jgi:riboflavin synthase